MTLINHVLDKILESSLTISLIAVGLDDPFPRKASFNTKQEKVTCPCFLQIWQDGFSKNGFLKLMA